MAGCEKLKLFFFCFNLQGLQGGQAGEDGGVQRGEAAVDERAKGERGN